MPAPRGFAYQGAWAARRACGRVLTPALARRCEKNSGRIQGALQAASACLCTCAAAAAAATAVSSPHFCCSHAPPPRRPDAGRMAPRPAPGPGRAAPVLPRLYFNRPARLRVCGDDAQVGLPHAARRHHAAPGQGKRQIAGLPRPRKPLPTPALRLPLAHTPAPGSHSCPAPAPCSHAPHP